MLNSVLCSRLALVACLLVGTSSCEFLQGPTKKPLPTPELERRAAYRWWDHPDAIEENLLAVGSSSVSTHMGMTRNTSMIDARSKLRTSLNERVLELIETWLESTSRSEDLPGLRRAVNASSFSELITSSIARSAPVVLRKEEREKMFTLVAVQSPSRFLDDLAAQVDAKIIQADEFFPKAETKVQVAKDLITLLKAEKARISASRAEFESGPIATETAPKKKNRR
jgi:hypothetical protein